MKKLILILIGTAAITSLSLAQVGQPENAGLTARTSTIYVNTNYNNNGLEVGDITITSNDKVLLAFEDDGEGLTDWEAIWTLYDSLGNLLTPAVTITNLAGSACFADPLSVENCTQAKKLWVW